MFMMIFKMVLKVLLHGIILMCEKETRVEIHIPLWYSIGWVTLVRQTRSSKFSVHYFFLCSFIAAVNPLFTELMNSENMRPHIA
jgi:hypothetical protein